MKKAILTSVVAAATLAALLPPAAVQAAETDQVEPTRMVDAFEATNGKFEGYRRSGAKGICAVGEFVGSPEGRSLSTASAFSGNPVPVIVRFSVGGANPKAADNSKGQRNLALQFNLPGGETWQMGNISAPVFGASTPVQMLGRVESHCGLTRSPRRPIRSRSRPLPMPTPRCCCRAGTLPRSRCLPALAA